MAQAQQKDLITKLADRGEDALQRLADMPGGHRIIDALNMMRDRIEEQQKRLRGIDALEKRLETLEKKVAKLERPTARRSTRSPARKAPTPKSPQQES